MTSKTDREICDAATPGPWTDGYECNRIYIEDKQVGGEDPLATFDHPLLGDAENKANALFSCWYDPPKVREMLDTIESQQAEVERLERRVAELHVQRDTQIELTKKWRERYYELQEDYRELGEAYDSLYDEHEPSELEQSVPGFKDVLEILGNIKIREE